MSKIKVNGSTKLSKKPKAKRVTSQSIRENKGKDLSPTWDGAEQWTGDEFARNFRLAMQFYNLEFSGKDLKPAILKWMSTAGYSKEDIATLKKQKDSRCGVTMGALASCLLRGMPAVHPEFNNGKDSAEWLRVEIAKIMEAGKYDIEPEEEVKSAVPIVSIQERVREAALGMTEEIEDAIEAFQKDPDAFNPHAFKVVNVLRAKEAKAAHARIIKDLYKRDLAELEELASGKADEQLREGYQHLSRKNVKKLIDFYTEISTACTMLAEEAKVNRAPRAKKPVAKEKLVAKLKYKKTDEALKLVSVSPVDIIGSKELWVFNTKTRKLGRYIAGEFSDLSVKGTSIIGFDEHKSVQKTLRKPADQLKEFKSAGKVQLRKFLEDINAVDTKMNGRLNEEIILLKVA